MTIEEAITAKLVAVLGALVGDRVGPDDVEQADGGDDGPPPASVVYQRAGDDQLVTLDGTRSDVRRDTYTVELWSADRADCESFRDLMFAAFSGANCRGRWGGGSGVFVLGAIARDAAADALPPAQGDEELDRAERLTLVVTWHATM